MRSNTLEWHLGKSGYGKYISIAMAATIVHNDPTTTADYDSMRHLRGINIHSRERVPLYNLIRSLNHE